MVRWGTDQDKQLTRLFDEGEANPERTDPDYLKQLWNKYQWVRHIYPTAPKNFYPTYRAKAADYLLAQAQEGGRFGE